MLEHALDIAAHIGRDQADGRRPHQGDGDVAGPGRRVPERDQAGLAVLREADADENDAEERDQREHALVGHLAQAGDSGGALRAKRHEGMTADEDGKAQDHDGKSHGVCLEHFAPQRYALFGPAGPIDCEKNATR